MFSKFTWLFPGEVDSPEDRGYLAGIHPLELWLVTYLRDHLGASRAEVAKQSEAVRQEVYGWLFKSSRHPQRT
jgi:hypothetical protein